MGQNIADVRIAPGAERNVVFKVEGKVIADSISLSLVNDQTKIL